MDFTISIQLNQQTLQQLHQQGFWLRVFKGGGTTTKQAIKNTVWYTTNAFSSNLNISWTNELHGYFSFQTKLKKGTLIQTNASCKIKAGECMTIQADGSTKLTTSGPAQAISFQNQNGREIAVGLQQMVSNRTNIFCVQPTINKATSMIRIPEKVLLVFETGKIAPNTIVTRTLNASILIHLSNSENTRSLSFDIDKSWDANNAVWATIFPNSIGIADKLWNQYSPYLELKEEA